MNTKSTLRDLTNYRKAQLEIEQLQYEKIDLLEELNELKEQNKSKDETISNLSCAIKNSKAPSKIFLDIKGKKKELRFEEKNGVKLPYLISKSIVVLKENDDYLISNFHEIVHLYRETHSVNLIWDGKWYVLPYEQKKVTELRRLETGTMLFSTENDFKYAFPKPHSKGFIPSSEVLALSSHIPDRHAVKEKDLVKIYKSAGFVVTLSDKSCISMEKIEI